MFRSENVEMIDSSDTKSDHNVSETRSQGNLKPYLGAELLYNSVCHNVTVSQCPSGDLLLNKAS